MKTYAAFLGHQPQISIAELAAVIPDFSLVRVQQKSVAIFKSKEDLDAKSIHAFGGTLFLARCISEGNVDIDDVPQILTKELESAKRGKITFSLRTLGLSGKIVRDMYKNCKQRLKKIDRPSRYVGTDRKAAQAIVLYENDLLSGKRGCELVVLHDEDHGLWVGRTIAAQDVEAYTKRDMHKPVRDTTVGLLPPKLAQILINLGLWAVCETKRAGKKGKKDVKPPKKLTVFDPFCGTGVIPLECLLRGWSVLASDNAVKAVNGCTKNIDWIRKEEKISKKDVPTTIWKHDARKPFELKKQSPDVVVTETSLGPNLIKKPPMKDVQKMVKESEELQEAFLRNAAETLSGVPLVCTWPVWYHSKGKNLLQKIWDLLPEIGYKAILPADMTGDGTGRTSLLYRRPDQFVGREIVILIPCQ